MKQRIILWVCSQEILVSGGAFFVTIHLTYFSYNVQKTQKQNTTTGLRTCNNILAMTKVQRNKVCLSLYIWSLFIYCKNWYLISISSHYIQKHPRLLEIKVSTYLGKKQQNLLFLPPQLQLGRRDLPVFFFSPTLLSLLIELYFNVFWLLLSLYGF